MAEKKHKLDIFRVLDHTSRKDQKFYRELTDDEQKAYMPLVAMRWMTGTTDARQIYFLNELVNPFVFTFTKAQGITISIDDNMWCW